MLRARLATCATIGAMLSELKEVSRSSSPPAAGLTGDLAGALDGPRPMPWGSWCLFVALGLGITVGIAWVGASLRPTRALRHERPVDPALLADGVRAFESGDWKASVRAFERVLSVQPGHSRALDYLDRIELTLQDADRLSLAEEALVAGQSFDAERLALAVPLNSPLFAQAEAVARTAVEQRALSPRTVHAGADHSTGATMPRLDVNAALGEALALYAAGRFSEAAARALSLAEQATPEARASLLSWVEDCRRFAERYSQLPEDPTNLVRHTSQLLEAIELDERLSDGHYARKLRTQAAGAATDISRVLLDGGDALGGCERAKDAFNFDPRAPKVNALLARCDAEAERKVNQARAMEAKQPAQALKLYRQALALSGRNTRAFRAARAGVEELAWFEER